MVIYIIFIGMSQPFIIIYREYICILYMSSFLIIDFLITNKTNFSLTNFYREKVFVQARFI